MKKQKILFEPSLQGPQDVIFSKTALILAETVATVPGAIYNVVNTPTALGKTIKKTPKAPTQAQIDTWKRWDKFVQEHNAAELLNTPEYPFHVDYYKVFNKTIFRRDKFTKKERFYLFGINICTKHMD